VKITGLAIIPPAGGTDCPRVTPELLASSLARYSRSNSGLESILALIDWKHPDSSVEKIFKYVDYGHASIAGLTGGIAMTIDNCSMLLAYKLFELSQLCDGQESSTRYIQMAPSGLPKAAAIGIPDNLAAEWLSVMTDAFGLYGDVYAKLDRQATENPGIVRLPKGANQKVIDRLRKNYALDRARYFIPLATQTNVGLIMSAPAPGVKLSSIYSLRPFLKRKPAAISCALNSENLRRDSSVTLSKTLQVHNRQRRRSNSLRKPSKATE
jgi:hypothetical protein